MRIARLFFKKSERELTKEIWQIRHEQIFDSTPRERGLMRRGPDARGSGERKLGRVTFIILNIILYKHNIKLPFSHDETVIYQSESGIRRTG